MADSVNRRQVLSDRAPFRRGGTTFGGIIATEETVSVCAGADACFIVFMRDGTTHVSVDQVENNEREGYEIVYRIASDKINEGVFEYLEAPVQELLENCSQLDDNFALFQRIRNKNARPEDMSKLFNCLRDKFETIKDEMWKVIMHEYSSEWVVEGGLRSRNVNTPKGLRLLTELQIRAFLMRLIVWFLQNLILMTLAR